VDLPQSWLKKLSKNKDLKEKMKLSILMVEQISDLLGNC
jgi:hypothetical protein